jgi:hypothetical protein
METLRVDEGTIRNYVRTYELVWNPAVSYCSYMEPCSIILQLYGTLQCHITAVALPAWQRCSRQVVRRHARIYPRSSSIKEIILDVAVDRGFIVIRVKLWNSKDN